MSAHKFSEITIGDSANAHLGDNVYNIHNEYHSQARPETPPNPTTNVPFRRDKDFVERGDLLDQIDAHLSEPAGRLALVGLGGIGKSQLAIEYCYRKRKASPETWVLWIHASNLARYEKSVRDVADLVKLRGRDNVQANVFQLLHDWLRSGKSGNWVLVLDNVDDAEFLLASNDDKTGQRLFDLLPVCDHGSILITSRSAEEARKLVEYSDTMLVDPMNEKDALALLEKKLGQQEDRTAILELIEMLGSIPLALTQAAKYIKHMGRRGSVKQYLEKLQNIRKSKQSVLDDDVGDLHRDREARNAIVITWRISFEHVNRIRPSAANLLSWMSFFDPQAIPEDLVRKSLGGHSYDKQDDAQAKDRFGESVSIPSRGGGQPSTHANEDGQRDLHQGELRANQSRGGDYGGWEYNDDDSFNHDISMLEGYSFLSVTTDASIFGMHRLVQVATQRWLYAQQSFGFWKERYIHCMYTSSTELTPEYEHWPTWRVIFPHVKQAIDLEPSEGRQAKKWAVIMLAAVHFAFAVGSVSWARNMVIQARAICAREFRDGSAVALAYNSSFSMMLATVGLVSEAEELNQDVAERRSRIHGREHIETLSALRRLVYVYKEQHRWSEAERLALQVLDTRKKVQGVEHLATVEAMADLATIYARQERFTEAEQLEVQVLETCKKLLGEDAEDTLLAESALACTYAQKGEPEKAEQLYTKLLESRKRLLGDEHPKTLTTARDLATTYWDQERFEEARQLQVSGLESQTRLLGKEHPETLGSMFTLALTLYELGDQEAAHALLTDCIYISSRVLGPGHEDTIDREELLRQWNEIRELHSTEES